MKSGPFVASVEAEAWDYEQFLESVVQVYKTLTGSAKLTFVETGHSISVTGDGRGKIEIDAVVDDGVSPCSAFLTVRLSLDQSHLPHALSPSGDIWKRTVSPRGAGEGCDALGSTFPPRFGGVARERDGWGSPHPSLNNPTN